VFTSDGWNWTVTPSKVLPQSLMTYANGYLIASVNSNNGTGSEVMVSHNEGKTWSSVASVDCQSIFWLNNGNTVLGVSSLGCTVSAPVSQVATKWKTSQVNEINQISDAVVAGNTFVVAAFSNSFGQPWLLCATSLDAVSWEISAIKVATGLTTAMLAAGNDQIVLINLQTPLVLTGTSDSSKLIS